MLDCDLNAVVLKYQLGDFDLESAEAIHSVSVILNTKEIIFIEVGGNSSW